MSTINVEVVEIKAINRHPGADRLEIAQVLGTECCVQVGKFKAGDLVVWFPPNILIPNAVAVELGVDNYLKHAYYPLEDGPWKPSESDGRTIQVKVQSKCRVAACRLRGTPSFGFIISLAEAQKVARVSDNWDKEYTFRPFTDCMKAGDILDPYFGAVKYEPPPQREPGIPRPKGFNGDAAPDNENFHKYTDIQNYYKYAPALEEGTPVRITEKLHGSNVRLGLVKVPGTDDFTFLAGSHKVNWKQEDRQGNTPIWWKLMTEPVMNLLTELCNEKHSVIMFGEVYGPGVQDMDYGAEQCEFRVFDISVDRLYLDWSALHTACVAHGVQTVPLLYKGPFSKAVLEEHTYGRTMMADALQIKSKFKDREGCVVTPLAEQLSRYLGGRLILKSVSADYLDRKGAQDNA